jgi:hypothetical protein
VSQESSSAVTESPTFAPSEAFRAQANAQASLYDDAEHDREAFWAHQASKLTWTEPWSRVLDWATRHTPAGSSTANSTSPETASIATSKTATAPRLRSTGLANPATPAKSPTSNSKMKCRRRRTRSPRSASWRATAWSFSCQ